MHAARCAILVLALAPSLSSAQALKTENFDSDPAWEGWNNRIKPKQFPTVHQDFGYRRAEGDVSGAVGGKVWRASIPAYYAAKIAPRTLNDKLSASGTFTISATSSGSGLFFGWFNAKQPGSGRPINTLGWFLDAENDGARLYVNLVTATNRSHGAFVTPFEPGKRHLPLKPDGKRYRWSITYDPQANKGDGRFVFTLEGYPPVTVDLPAGYKAEGARFDYFGMMNLHRAGGPMTVHVEDLTLDSNKIDLTQDPGWRAVGNRAVLQEREVIGAHDFGFSPTSRAGGKRGELGGNFWRTEEPFAYYADRVGPLALRDRLEARGKIAFTVGAPDSGLFLGWFHTSAKNDQGLRNFVGVYLEGPSRVGHYFRPYYATMKGTRGDPGKGPVLLPDGRSRAWSMSYDPQSGVLQVSLDRETFDFKMPPGHQAEGATLDRFGVFTVRTGGGNVKVWLDDLSYTAGGN
jgi:hypothetical protein